MFCLSARHRFFIGKDSLTKDWSELIVVERNWRLQTADEAEVAHLMAMGKLSPTMARLLAIRGITTKEDLETYFNVGVDSYHDPFLMEDMKVAVKRIIQALDRQEMIYIYGDYDVDGVTSTSVLYMFLNEVGCQVDYYIPDRHEEGYGINEGAIDALKEQGAHLMISVDTGITAVKQVEHANEIGLDVIITDHHECQATLPRALAVLNPKRPGCQYPFKHLAGCGVTFKLIQAISRKLGCENIIWKYLDIVAVGTVADIVPLKGENRAITRMAFTSMPTTWNIGLKALMKVSDLEGKKMTSGRIGFGLGPRLNAAGRIKHAKEAVELFVSHNPERCMRIAEGLDQVNKDRRALESKIFEEAVGIIEKSMVPSEKKILVIASEGWHHGVIGIVASKLVERYYRPTIILAIEDGIASGSARSVEGFSIFDALMASGDLFDKFGGHEMAAGMSLDAGLVATLDKALNAYANDVMDDQVLIPKIKVDMVLPLEEVSLNLIEQIQAMEPFGIGNREPTFQCEGPVKSIRRIGNERTHLKVALGEGKGKDGVAFSKGETGEWLRVGQECECVCTLDINVWKDIRKPQLMIKDLRHVSEVRSGIQKIIQDHITIDYLNQPIVDGLKIDRELCADFYRVLKTLEKTGLDMLYYGKLLEMANNDLTYGLPKYMIMLEIFSEVGLLRYELKTDYLTFDLIEVKKVALTASTLYNRFLR